VFLSILAKMTHAARNDRYIPTPSKHGHRNLMYTSASWTVDYARFKAKALI